MKKQIIYTSTIITLLLFSSVNSFVASESEDYFFKLIIHTQGGGSKADYVLWVGDFLKSIKINTAGYVEVSMYDWQEYYKNKEDWDLTIFRITEPKSQDLRHYLTERGKYNFFRLNSEIPYNLGSELYQSFAANTSNGIERNQISWDWQILLMDKIIPVLPLFSPQHFEAIWGNLEGFNARWGLSDSLPYMNFSGLHMGQESTEEFNLGGGNFWTNANPLVPQSMYSSTDNRIIDLIYSPLLQWSPYILPIKTGIIKEWIRINDNHYKFQMRDDVFWNPSYNITARNSSSVPLSSIPDEELLRGLRGNYSNGTNQQVTAKDAVFTLLAFSTPEISNNAGEYKRFSRYYVDPVDEHAFHIIFHNSSNTFERSDYSEFWKSLSVPLLPEFYLNSSNTENYYTSGNQSFIGLYPEIINTLEWKLFSKSAFGCGKYMLDYKIPYQLSVLQKSPFWFNIGAFDGTVQTCDIQTINIHRIIDDDLNYKEFKEGGVDRLEYSYFYGDEKKKEEIQTDSRLEMLSFPRDYMYYLAFNLERPIVGGKDNNIWLDKSGKTQYTKALAIRKAICHAINFTKMNKKIHNDESIRNHLVNPYIDDFIGKPFPIQYDGNLTLAKEWMEAAGYSYDIITLKANSNLMIYVICIVLISISVYKSRIRKERKKASSYTILIRK